MTTSTLDVADRLDIMELLARYGNIIDDREFSRTGEVFTADARYDVDSLSLGVHRGVEAIVEFWIRGRHPLAHHVTNIEISAGTDGATLVYSKVIAPDDKGRCRSYSYRDVVVPTGEGWRIADRIITMRTSESIPAVS
jgi:hypothetical protein